MWIGVLWAGLRVAFWITHVGGQISPCPAGIVAEKPFISFFLLFRAGGPKWGLYQADRIANICLEH